MKKTTAQNQPSRVETHFFDPIHILSVTYYYEYDENNFASFPLLHVFTVLQKKCVLCSAHFCILLLSLRYVWEQT